MADELLRSKHVFGNRVNLEAAIESGKVDSFDILFLHDENGKPIIGWLNRNNEPVFLEDESRECVIEVEALPESGEVGKIYIFGEDGYFWDGQKFINLCKPTDVSELDASIKALETLVEKKADSEEVNAQIAEAVSDAKAHADEEVAKLAEKSEALYDEIKYEVSDTPVGTLVNYFEKEIRVMCPSDAEFNKQNVGTGGDANCYYMTLKTYAPNDDVVGYIEHLGNQVDAEILTDLKTDEYGRKYQPTWLALAKYDDATGWNYYGKNSRKDRYIGWDYQIDWYDANNVKIASDSIRINLSNEECHSVIEPYYIHNATKEMNTKIETIMSMFEIVEI